MNKNTPESIYNALKPIITGLDNPSIRLSRASGIYTGKGWDFSHSTGLSIYLPLGEQDYRPTLVDTSNPLCPAKPERQLTYYADPTQLAFTEQYPNWSRLLVRLEQNVSVRRAALPAGCQSGLSAQAEETPLIDTRPFNSPAPLMPIRQTVYLPAIAR